ncbi:MAG: hypothetical protein OXG11_11900 [Chloroflexi bacterium]|nr:hypothetical protein [Chloroflexota bacterium]
MPFIKSLKGGLFEMRDIESFENLDGESPPPSWRDGGWVIAIFVAGAVVGAIAALLAAARLGRTEVKL